jgi:hypothetical protein
LRFGSAGEVGDLRVAEAHALGLQEELGARALSACLDALAHLDDLDDAIAEPGVDPRRLVHLLHGRAVT